MLAFQTCCFEKTFTKGQFTRMVVYIALAAAAALVGIDQLLKWLAVTCIRPEGSIPLLKIGGKEWLNLTYQENTGAAFSILEGQQLFLIVLTSIIIIGLVVVMVMKKVKRKPYIWAFALMIAGGLGNLIDRIFLGYVIDFIDVRIINFAVFNFADICAVCGGILLFVFVIYDEIVEWKKRRKTRSVASQAENGQTGAENE